jgi:3,4-dihydroxy-2-butanone 4-phosphate synthase
MVVETLAPALGMEQRELPACVIRTGHGELAVEWTELASSAVSAVLTEAMLTSGAGEAASPPALGRVSFCALAPAAAT